MTPGHPLSRYGITGLTKHARKVCLLANPCEDCGSVSYTTHATTHPCVQTQITLVSFASTTQVRTDVPVPPTMNQMVPPTQELRVPLLQITSVASTLNT